MPEDKPVTFRQFVQWLYVGHIKTNNEDEWLGAWVLGDEIGSIAFRNCAMTKLVEHYYNFRSATVATVYLTSVSGSKLRKWAVDEFRFRLKAGAMNDEAGWMSMVESEPEFAIDLAKSIVRGDKVKRRGAPLKDLFE